MSNSDVDIMTREEENKKGRFMEIVCPELAKIPNGDEVYYYCKMDEVACKVEYQNEYCDIREDYMKERE